MSVLEIEAAVQELADKELTEFASWFAEYHWRRWDEQIESDLEAGKLDKIIEEAEREYEAGLSTPL
jgi:hypothetical protein